MQGRSEGGGGTGLLVSWERCGSRAEVRWGMAVRRTGLFRVGLLAWTSQAAHREKQDRIGQLLLCNNHTRAFLFIVIRLLLNLQDLSS